MTSKTPSADVIVPPVVPMTADVGWSFGFEGDDEPHRAIATRTTAQALIRSRGARVRIESNAPCRSAAARSSAPHRSVRTVTPRP